MVPAMPSAAAAASAIHSPVEKGSAVFGEEGPGVGVRRETVWWCDEQR